MSNVKFLPYTLVLHCLPWTLSVSVKLITLHENSWKGKELDHIEYLYKPLLNINTLVKLVKLWDRLAYSGFFAIYMGQLLGPQFGQMVRKIQDW